MGALILKIYILLGKMESLLDRASLLEVGLSGHVTKRDIEYAERMGYRRLNRFEKWFLKPMIEAEN